MSEISHIARPHGTRAAIIAHGPSTACPIEPPRGAYTRQDTVAMDWRRLRTIVDALLRRAAASKDVAAAMVVLRDRAGAATSTSPEKQESIHG